MAMDNHNNDSCNTFGLFCVNAKSMTNPATKSNFVDSAIADNTSPASVPFLASPSFSVMSLTIKSVVVLKLILL